MCVISSSVLTALGMECLELMVNSMTASIDIGAALK